MKKQPIRSSDPCLWSFLDAREEPEAKQRLEEVIGGAKRIIQGILGRQGIRDKDDLEDLHGEVVYRITRRLQKLRDSADEEGIGDFPGFVATTARHVFDDHLARKYPNRACLKRLLLLLLNGRTGQRGFALWELPSRTRCCGFAAWQGWEIRRTAAYEQLLTNPHAFAKKVIGREDITTMNPADLLAALFNGVGGPISFNELFRVVAELQGVKDYPVESLETRNRNREESNVELPIDPSRRWEDVVGTTVHQRERLRWLWSEIRQHPRPQRAALLLGPKRSSVDGAIEALEVCGIASFREIAKTLEIAADELADLNPPLEDNAIAELLGCTRQQVINLRKVACERLTRRKQALEKHA